MTVRTSYVFVHIFAPGFAPNNGYCVDSPSPFKYVRARRLLFGSVLLNMKNNSGGVQTSFCLDHSSQIFLEDLPICCCFRLKYLFQKIAMAVKKVSSIVVCELRS